MNLTSIHAPAPTTTREGLKQATLDLVEASRAATPLAPTPIYAMPDRSYVQAGARLAHAASEAIKNLPYNDALFPKVQSAYAMAFEGANLLDKANAAYDLPTQTSWAAANPAIAAQKLIDSAIIAIGELDEDALFASSDHRC